MSAGQEESKTHASWFKRQVSKMKEMGANEGLPMARSKEHSGFSLAYIEEPRYSQEGATT